MADSVTITAGFHDGTDGNDNLLTSVGEWNVALQQYRTTLYSSGARGFGGDDTISNNGYLENILFDGGAGNDSIVNGGYNHHVNNVTLLGGEGDDRIKTYGDNALIDAGDGADNISNNGNNATITSGAGNDSISNYGDGAIITAGDGDDTITSSGNDVTIDAGAGDDTVCSNGANITVHGGQGNDSLSGNGVSSLDSKIFLDDTIGNNYFHISQSTNATIQAGAGDDIINSDGYNENLLINAGDGANSITSRNNSNITINAADGNDTINFYDGNGILIQAGDGANYIYSYNYNLADMADFTILSGAGKDTVSTYGSRTLIVSGAGNDSITHVGANSTIQGGDGDDYINNHDGGRDYSTNPTIGANNLVEGGAGNDSIYNACNNVTVNGGTGDDYISSGAVDGALLLGGDGNDSLYNTGNINREFPTNTTLNGGNGDDFIDNLGNNVTINGGSGNDTISLRTGRGPGNTYSGSENVLINYTFGDGNDLIEGFNETSTLSISGGGEFSSLISGSDVIINFDTSSVTLDGAATLDTLNIICTSLNVTNTANDTLITGTAFNDTIFNRGSNVTIQGFGGNDSIVNSGANVTINGGAGDDSINNSGGTNVTVNGGEGNDCILNSSQNITIEAGEGNDTIYNWNFNATIDAGSGDDYISNSGNNSTIDGGDGDDYIWNEFASNVTFVYSGKGNDTIGGFNTTSTVSIVGGEFSSLISGRDVKIIIGEDSLLLYDAATLDNINIVGTGFYVTNAANDTLLTGTVFNDTIINRGFDVTIQARGDNDSIYNASSNVSIDAGDGNDTIDNSGANVTINGGEGDDSINNSGGTNVTVNGGEGNDTVYNSGANVTINGGEGNDSICNITATVSIDGGQGDDTISNTNSKVTIDGGEGNDFIENGAVNVLINGGAGDDKITNRGANVTFVYNSGDGNDLIEGFNATSTLSISGGGYTSIKSGSDVVLGVDNSSITLSGAANLETLNIIGTLEGSGVNVTNEDDDKTITGTEYADTINNSGQRVLITSYASRDIITNSGASTAILSGAGNDVIGNGAANVTIDSGEGNDVIGNIGANNSIVSGEGNDSVDNQYGDNSTITTGDGDDTINNYNSENVLIEAGAGADFIYSHGSVTGSTIDTGESDDTINNSGDGVYIVAGEGADSVNNSGANVSISLGSGDDSIIDNTGASVAVDMGAGNDYIFSTGANSSITGGEGADYIYNGGSKDRGNHLGSYTLRGGDNVTMTGGADNDIITNYKGDYAVIDGGAGDDTIYNSYGNHLTITDLEGNNYISSGGGVDIGGGHSSAITTGDGNDTIRIANYANDVTVNSGGGNDWIISQWSQGMIVHTGAGNDTIGTNGSSYSTLDAGAGDDLISVIDFRSYVMAGAGNDSIYYEGSYTTIEAGDGDDTITHGTNNGYNMYLDGGKGNDLIHGLAEGTLLGGDGADTITTNGWNNLINGGAGNDLISLKSSNDTITYAADDGNDTIIGFSTTSTLDLGGATYASQTNGEDVSITVGKGSILLRGAATLETLNIIGEEEEGPTWHLDGTTATYGTSDKTEVTLTGIGSLDGVKLDGKTVTLSAAALNGENVTITKGYTLKIDGTVPTSSKKIAATWTSDGDEHTYTAAGTPAYYKLASNKLTFTPAKGGETFTLTGIASTKGVKVSGTKVTVGKTALGDSDVTLTTEDGFKLAFDKSVITAKEIKAGWKKFTYTAAGTTAGYKLDGDTITHTEQVGGEQFTITGLKNTNDVTVEDKVVTIGKNSLNGKNVTFSGEDFEFVLGDDVPTKADEVDGGFTSVAKGTATYRTAHTSEAYELGDGTITYTAAQGGHDIKIAKLNTSATLDDMEGAIDIVEDDDGVQITFMDAEVLTTKAPTITTPKGVAYTVAVDEALSTAEESFKWNTKGTAATLSADTGATYTVAKNKVVYTKGKASTAAVLTGLTNTNLATPEDNVITLDADNLGTKTSLKSNAGGYSIELTGDMDGKTFVGSAAADTIDIAATGALVDGGKGNDQFNISGSDVTILSSAGNDTTNFADGLTVSLSGTTTVKELEQTDSGVQLTFSNKATLMVAEVTDTFDVIGKKQTFTVDTDKFALAESLTFGKSSVTVAADFTGALTPDDDIYLGGKLSTVATIDASAVTEGISIDGNAKANVIYGGGGDDTLWGGAGNDTLIGGDGSDTFIYNSGEGKDVVLGFTDDDLLEITGNFTTSFNKSGTEIALKVGKGSLTLKDFTAEEFNINGETYQISGNKLAK